MSWVAKSRTSAMPAVPSRPKPGPTGTASAAAASANVRVSNGLKEFLWLVNEPRDAKQGRILDLGPVWQATVTFFIDKGYRVSTEDLLRAWKEFLSAEEESLRRAAVGNGGERVSPAMPAEKFLDIALQYPEENFHGVLAWDLFDYLDAQLLPRVMDRLYTMLRPGGALLSLFHSRTPERFSRYRILDTQTVELIASPTLAIHSHVFQNREILDLFGKFRSSKTFVGRDQVREGLFLK
jgi:hypothetical protein